MSISVNAKRVKDVTEIRVYLQHVSEDGQRQDPKTGKFIPADFIQQLQIKVDDRLLADANLGGGLSHNPYFLFKAKGLKPGAKISAEWLTTREVVGKDGKKESKEEKGRAETTLA